MGNLENIENGIKDVLDRHNQINKCFEEGKKIDEELTKDFVTFPISETILYNINEEVIDVDNSICKIIDKTKNSICVWIGKKTDKGINCSNWFSIKDFEKRFKKKNV